MSLPQLPCFAAAIYSWSGEQESDLGMIEGDHIEVLDYGDGNWWFGRLQRNKMQGVFPKNFVKILPLNDLSRRQLSIHNSRSFTNSPSFSSIHSLKKMSPSYSQHNLAHSQSQQFYQSDKSDEENENKFSFQSSQRFSTKPKTKFYSTNDLARYSQLKKSPIRDEVEYTSGSESEDDEGLDSEDELPPPPPPKTRYSKENLTKNSLLSSPSSANVRSSLMYDFSTSSIESPPSKNATCGDLSMLKNSMHRGGLGFSQQLYDSTWSTDTEKSILFGHSNFSATSAGSLARHKYQHDLNDKDSRLKEVQRQGGLQTFDEQEQVEILKKVFVDKKQSRHPKLLKKLFSKDADGSLVSLDDQIHGLSINDSRTVESDMSIHSFDEEIDPRIEILQQPTFNQLQKSKREERVMDENPYFILRPFDGIDLTLNHNEITAKPVVNIDSIPLYHVDKYVRVMPVDKFESIENIALNLIATRFQSDLEKIRAIYCFCTERIELIPVEYEPMDRRSSPKMSDIIYQKRATPYQLTWLFKLMASILHIKTDLILGHFKNPCQDILEIAEDDKSPLTHSWCSIVIEGQWRIIDVVLGNLTNELYVSLNANESNYQIQQFFYFLAKPLDVIYTHLPLIVEQQHIQPPIDPVISMALPPLYPAYSHYGIKFYRYNNALLYMKNLELFEFQIQVPPDVEILAKIQCETDKSHDSDENDIQALSQPLWHKNKKIFILRGALPPKRSMGYLKIYVGDKNTDSNEYMMCSMIKLCHQGTYKSLSYVKRYPTVHTLNQDLYIASPQYYQISLGETTSFSIRQHPSFQIDSYNKHKLQTKLALQMPSGKIVKLTAPAEGKLYGDWNLNMKINERGLWRGLVLTDDGLRWSIFAEWDCQ